MKNPTFLLFFALLLLTACEKEEPEPCEDPDPWYFDRMTTITESGLVIDQQGNPVQGATVSFGVRDDLYPMGSEIEYAWPGEITNAEGKFTYTHGWDFRIEPSWLEDTEFWITAWTDSLWGDTLIRGNYSFPKEDIVITLVPIPPLSERLELENSNSTKLEGP